MGCGGAIFSFLGLTLYLPGAIGRATGRSDLGKNLSC